MYCSLSYLPRWWGWCLRVMIFALHSLICISHWRRCCWCLRTMIFALPPLICIKYVPDVKWSTYIEICLYCALSYVSYNSLVTLMYADSDFCTAFSNLYCKFCWCCWSIQINVSSNFLPIFYLYMIRYTARSSYNFTSHLPWNVVTLALPKLQMSSWSLNF